MNPAVTENYTRHELPDMLVEWGNSMAQLLPDGHTVEIHLYPAEEPDHPNGVVVIWTVRDDQGGVVGHSARRLHDLDSAFAGAEVSP